MRRDFKRIIVTMLAIVLMSSVSAFAEVPGATGENPSPVLAETIAASTVPSVSEADPVDLTSLIEEAVLAAEGKGILQSSSAGVVRFKVENNGDRIAVVDMTAPGAPKGTPVIDMSVVRGLGLAAVDIVVWHADTTDWADATADANRVSEVTKPDYGTLAPPTSIGTGTGDTMAPSRPTKGMSIFRS